MFPHALLGTPGDHSPALLYNASGSLSTAYASPAAPQGAICKLPRFPAVAVDFLWEPSMSIQSLLSSP